MNVIIINDYAFVNGGAGQVAINTARMLADNNINVILFAAVGPIDCDLKKIKNLEVVCLNQYDILSDPCRIRAVVQGIWNFKAKKEFERLLERFNQKETIIHIHSISKAISSSVVPTAKKKGFRILYHLHDYGIACPNMGFFDYKKNSICTCKALSISCILKNCDSRNYFHKCWRVLRQLIQKNIGGIPKCIDGYIYISNLSLKTLYDYLLDAQIKVFLPNSVKVIKQPRVEAENNSKIIYIGRLSPEKNPQLLAKVTYELDLPVVFIGSGVCENEIRKINNKAIITGWVSQEQISELISTARVVVFPSKCKETQGMAVIEALAYGIPVIVSNTCAAADVVVEHENGLLFSVNDEKELASSLQMMNDNQVVRRMSLKAYSDFWNNEYGKDTYICNLLKIYEKILDKGGAYVRL